jgi:hypothetical protein
VRTSATRIHAEKAVNTHGSDLRKSRSSHCPSMALLVQRRAAHRAVVVIVREPRDSHALVNAPAPRERAADSGPAPPRNAAVNDARRGGTSNHGTRGACASDARNAKDDVSADVEATDARGGWSRRRDGQVTPAARRGVAPSGGGVAMGVSNRADGRGCVGAASRRLAPGGAGNARGVKNAADERVVRRVVQVGRVERGRGAGQGGTPGNGTGEGD